MLFEAKSHYSSSLALLLYSSQTDHEKNFSARTVVENFNYRIWSGEQITEAALANLAFNGC